MFSVLAYTNVDTHMLALILYLSQKYLSIQHLQIFTHAAKVSSLGSDPSAPASKIALSICSTLHLVPLSLATPFQAICCNRDTTLVLNQDRNRLVTESFSI